MIRVGRGMSFFAGLSARVGSYVSIVSDVRRKGHPTPHQAGIEAQAEYIESITLL
jgi:ribosomal protein L13E